MAKQKPLVSQHLEGISGTALDRYQKIIREYVRNRHGIYSLYRRDRLYYVGLTSNLRSRLSYHLKDKHRGKWDRFSVYLTIGDRQLKELESLVLRIVRPTGNSQTGKFAKAEDLKRRLARDMKDHFRREVDRLLNRRRAERWQAETASRHLTNGGPRLARLVNRRYALKARFRRKWHYARLRRDGRIRCRGRLYNSPSRAAAAITRQPTNGWFFWTYERAPGDWVRLRELRGR